MFKSTTQKQILPPPLILPNKTASPFAQIGKQIHLTIKCCLFLLLLIISLPLDAQILKEKRVYYLDCSYSMKTNKIWDTVCDKLKKAIDKVDDATTELVIVPFAINSTGGIGTCFTQNATPNGKEKLKEQIDGITLDRSSMTYHYVPLEDFYNNRVDATKVTYMFLMTDGQDEWTDKDKFPLLLQRWKSKYGDKNVYGFYVMLHKSAKNEQIKSICDKSDDHLWSVETADININLIRLDSKAIFNARNETYFDLPISGNVQGIKLSAEFDPSSPYNVEKTSIINNSTLRVYVQPTVDVSSLPNSKNCTLKITKSGGDDYAFLVTENVTVECIYEKERSLKISVK